MACYGGPNPINDPEKRRFILEWARPMFEAGLPMDKIGEAINDRWFKGRAPSKWIYDDILKGKGTPYEKGLRDVWKAQFDRRVKTQEAENLALSESKGFWGKMLSPLKAPARKVAVAYHFTVFPFVHAGQVAFLPKSWGIFTKGLLDTFGRSLRGSAMERLLTTMEHDERFGLGMKSEVDMGKHSKATGILSSFKGASKNAWDILTYMRFQLWKQAMDKHFRSDMTPEELLAMGKKMAIWANHATGSGKGFLMHKQISWIPFGPKLWQSHLNRIFGDPIETIKTFAKGDKATPAEKALAWKNFNTLVTTVGTQLGFLAVNQGVNWALAQFTGQKKVDDINWNNPSRSDWMAFKAFGLNIEVPGPQTEVRTVAKILATYFLSTPKDRRGASKREAVSGILGQYQYNKINPDLALGGELLAGENWMGRPLPGFLAHGSKPTPKRPQMSWVEFAGEHAPIPLEGPIGFVYDEFQKNGMSKKDALTQTKALIWYGLEALPMTALDVLGLRTSPEKPEPTPKK